MVGNELYSLHLFFFSVIWRKIFIEICACCNKFGQYCSIQEVFLPNSSSKGFLPQFVYTLRISYTHISYAYVSICVVAIYIILKLKLDHIIVSFWNILNLTCIFFQVRTYRITLLNILLVYWFACCLRFRLILFFLL